MSPGPELRAELVLLRPALEMAIIVARQGVAAPVRIEAPRQLRPFLRFARLPPRALEAARAALDDPTFRARVADRCDPEEVGRAGWLFLTRPDGWSDEFDALVVDETTQGDRRAEHTAQRALERASATLAEQQARLDEAATELDSLRRDVAEGARREAELTSALAEANTAAERARDERTRAVRELKAMEQRLAQRTAELRAVEASVAEAGHAASGDLPDVGEPAATPAVDAERLAALVADLGRRWRSLGPVLTLLETELDAADPHPVSVASPASSTRPPGARRRALRLGHGLADGTVAAARWLLAQPDVVVFVDGYNVTMSVWPDLPVAAQRDALERAAAVVQQRTGARIVLYFDGDAGGGPAVRSSVGSAVRVRFTDEATEADDAILAAVEHSTSSVVVVVSNDRRVVEGARARGANVVRSTEFETILLDG